MEHKLIIICQDDAIAECSCGRWFYSRTGRAEKWEIEEWFNKHMDILRSEGDSYEKEG